MAFLVQKSAHIWQKVQESMWNSMVTRSPSSCFSTVRTMAWGEQTRTHMPQLMQRSVWNLMRPR